MRAVRPPSFLEIKCTGLRSQLNAPAAFHGTLQKYLLNSVESLKVAGLIYKVHAYILSMIETMWRLGFLPPILMTF